MPALLIAAAALASPAPATVLAGLPPALAQALRHHYKAQISGGGGMLDCLLVADDHALVNSRAAVEYRRQMIAGGTTLGFHVLLIDRLLRNGGV